jgi:hypothetical protein
VATSQWQAARGQQATIAPPWPVASGGQKWRVMARKVLLASSSGQQEPVEVNNSLTSWPHDAQKGLLAVT